MKRVFLSLLFIVLVSPALPQMKIVISGDAMVHLPQITKAGTGAGGFDFSPSFRYMSRKWKDADYAIVNFETTISPDGKYSGYPKFSSPREFASALRDAGVDMFLMANNHIMDRGAAGVAATLSWADSLGVVHTGVYAPDDDSSAVVVLSRGGVSAAVLDYTYSVNGNPVPPGVHVNFIDTAVIRRDIARIRDRVQFVIVVYHWGEEYQKSANGHQRELAAWTMENGADLIVGSHPHVVQKPGYNVIYSLGNLVSNQSYVHTDVGMSVEITLAKFRRPRVKTFLHWCDRENGYRILTLDDTVSVDNPDLLTRKITSTESRLR